MYIKCKLCRNAYSTNKQVEERLLKYHNKEYYKTEYICKKCQKGYTKLSNNLSNGKVSNDNDINLEEFIPKKQIEYINRKIGGVLDEDLITFHLKSKNPLMKNILFIGETGTGKNALIHHYCYKNKIPMYRLVMNAGTSTEDIVGQYIMQEDGKFKFHYQILIKMMKTGGIFVFDEINVGQKELLHILNSITDFERKAIVTQNRGEVIQAVDNFLVIACMNPPDEYDLNDIPFSLKSRFCTYYFDYEEKVDKRVIKDEKLLKFAKEIRIARVNKQIETPLSTRDLLQFQELRNSLGYEIAKEMLINKFTNGEKNVVKTALEINLEKAQGDIKNG